jgi:hypothetical protein
MVDESWARIFPYGSEAAVGSRVELELRITNHAPAAMKYDVRWNLPRGLQLLSAEKARTIPARQDGALRVRLRASTPGLHVVTADVAFAGRELKQWTEGLLRVR